MSFAIGTEERRYLLASARESIAAELAGRAPVWPPRPVPAGALDARCGAFVSLHQGGRLRGCIGRMTASGPLEETVRLMAREAAFADPRFPPLEGPELARCLIEISALSPPEPCPDPRKAVVGVHGLWIIHRGRSGVFLPQVPVEQGWGLEEYLDQLCRKAGLPPGSADEKGARVYSFTATVFGEADSGSS
jgi:AmmeMemoRadiSam system protein A